MPPGKTLQNSFLIRLVIVALYLHAWKLRDDLELSREERIELRGDIVSHSMIPLTGLLSLMLIGLCGWIGLPQFGALSGFIYSLMSFSGVVGNWARRRAARELG